MNSVIVDALALFVGRRTLWRFGRLLYLKARADSKNDMRTNGELLLQRHVCKIFEEVTGKLVIFDVGANVGDWTLLFLEGCSRLGSEDRVELHAFEPGPTTLSTLKSRVSKHPLGNVVRVVSAAVSSSEGTAEMFNAGDNAGTSSLHEDATSPVLPRVEVHKTTAYAYCLKHGIQVVHFLKCDTEGHDMEVLYGARRLFEEQRIMVCQFEYNHRWVYSRHYLKDVFDYAQGLPYSLGKVTSKGVEIYPGWHPELERFFEGNYVLLHQDACHWFPIQTGVFDGSNTFTASRGIESARFAARF